jgi:hypothetical protein
VSRGGRRDGVVFEFPPFAAQIFGGGAVHALVRRCCGRATRLAIGVVYAIIKACISEAAGKMPTNFINARPDRLPMGLMARRIDMLRDRPLQSLWNEIIERWVIAQHVHWSAVRGGDGNQRLRIGLEGGGWIREGTRAIGPFVPTSDRLATLLSLGSECGLFRKGAGTDPSFGREE